MAKRNFKQRDVMRNLWASDAQMRNLEGLCRRAGATMPTGPITAWEAIEFKRGLESRCRKGILGRDATMTRLRLNV